MNETWRRTLVGSVIVVIGLGLLEIVLNTPPAEPPVAEVAATAERPAGVRGDQVEAEGLAARVDAALPASLPEPVAR